MTEQPTRRSFLRDEGNVVPLTRATRGEPSPEQCTIARINARALAALRRRSRAGGAHVPYAGLLALAAALVTVAAAIAVLA